LLLVGLLLPLALGWLYLLGARLGAYDVVFGACLLLALVALIPRRATVAARGAPPPKSAEGTVRRWSDDWVAGGHDSPAESAAEARASGDRFRLTFEQAPMGIALVAPDGRFRQFNQAVCDLTGYSSEELRARTFAEITHPDDRDTHLAARERLLSGEILTHQRETRCIHSSGSVVWVQLVVSLVRDGEGQPLHFLSQMQDVTARRRAQELLADALAFNQSVLSAVPVGIVTYKPAGQCMSCNDAAASIIGASAEEIMSQDFRTLESWHRSGLLDLADRTIATREPQESDIRVLTSFGKELRCTARATLFEAGGEDLLLLILDDVSLHKRVEAQLRQLSRAMEQSPVSVMITDIEGHIEYVNPRFSETTGYALDEIRGKNPRLLKGGEASRGEYRHLWQTIKAGGEWRGEFHNRKKTGELFWESASVSPILDEGRMTHFLAVKEDITERKQVEESRQRLAAILDATPDFVAIGDPQGRLLYVNDAGRRLLGLGANDDLSACRVADGQPEWARTLILETALPTAMSEGVWSAETAFLDASGQEIPFSQIVLAHRAPDGRVDFLSTIARDLSDQRRVEEMFHQSQRLEAIGRLAGGVAHDFNNLLGVITGFGELIWKQLPEDRLARERLQQILKAAERAAGLTRQLLAFSRKQVMQPKQLDLNATVRELGRMLERVVGEDVEIDIHTAEGLGFVMADPTQLDQVLMNLVVNARDAMPKGGKLTIETSNEECDSAYAGAHPPAQPGRFVMLAVSDDGEGMDEETQKHVFEPFFTTKSPGAGTGLGMATVYGVVKQSGGFVWVYSEVGVGTTFKIYLPRVDDEGGTPSTGERHESVPRGHETVLLVEDTEDLRHAVREMLEERGYHVLAAPDGEQALALLAESRVPIELLLTDVVMPKMSGAALAIQAAMLHPSIRVLYMSGYSGGAVWDRGVLPRDTTLLQKPFTSDALARAVRNEIDRKAE
jgi:PAS domain S-box-containing protein